MTERDGYWSDATSESPSGEATWKEFSRARTPPNARVCKEGGMPVRSGLSDDRRCAGAQRRSVRDLHKGRSVRGDGPGAEKTN
ncbi:hypothetical protein BHE74_00035553 [Ensete ventricosum]|nr:hypothetical protein BHE74_00035553 [Ensete ventricosum]